MPDGNHTKSKSPRISIRLERSDRRCLCFLVMVVSGFSLLEIELSENTTTVTAESIRFQLDLNSASVEELILLPGIGEVRAAAIVRSRRETGVFHTVDDLRRIKGIGPKTLAGMRELVFVQPQSDKVSQPEFSSDRLVQGQDRKIAAVPARME